MGIQADKVIAAALDLLDEVGVDGLTMRRLAQALDIQAASLYWHFANKQTLLDGMADALMDGVALAPQAGPWQSRIRQTADEIRRALLARRDGARVFAGTYVPTENVLRVAESLMAPLREAGASPRLAASGAFSLLYYVLGFVIEEQAIGPAEAGKLDPASRRGAFETLAADRFPQVFAAMDDIFDADFDARFAAGVELWIAGVEQQLTRTLA